MIGYLDLASGISGDMFLGCLIDAGWPLSDLERVLDQLQPILGELQAGPSEARPWAVRSQRVHRGSLQATLVTVEVSQDHPHRSLDDIRQLIETSGLAASVQAQSIAVFARLARAEARVHGTPVEEVQFHEVGALDAIVDIVGSVAGLHALGIDTLYASPVPLSHGWTQAAHGLLPLPAPATLELLSDAHAPTRPAPGPGELVTPTGAALLAQLATFAQPEMRLHRIGTGAGQRDLAWPNVTRLWLGEAANTGLMVQLDTNIDDMNPEFYAMVSERIFAAGARDVWLTPVQMKKGRPALVLSVLAPAGLEAAMADLMLRETTTLGVRVHTVRRHEAGREVRLVNTAFGPVPVKLKRWGETLLSAAPEYEDCARLAKTHQVPIYVIYEAARARAQAILSHSAEFPAAGLPDEPQEEE